MSSKKKNLKKKKQERKKTIKTSPILFWKDRSILTWMAALIGITAICYLPSLQNGFVNWDDPDYVERNVYIHQATAENIKVIFTQPIAENYHPLTFMSLMLDYAIGDGDPLPFHVTNLLLHLLSTGAVFIFILLLYQRNVLVAFVTALLFGIHPMHVESVAWVTERKDVLYGLFFIIGLITYVRYAQTKQRKYLLYTFIWCLLSMLSKPAAVTFFMVLMLIDYWYDRGWNSKVLLEKVPFFLLAVGLSVLTIMIQSDTAVKDLDEISLLNRICAGGYGFNVYVLKFLVPYNLATYYPYPPLSNPPIYFYLMPVVGLAIVGVWYWLFWKKKPVLFGLLFFMLTISITLQIFSFGGAIMSERYTYIPYIGLAFCMGLLLDYLLQRFPKQKSALFGAFGLYGLILAIGCFQQTKVWKNGETLWSQVIDSMAFQSAIPNSNRGYYRKQNNDFEGALQDFNRSLELSPNEHGSRVGKGNVFFEQRQYQAAINEYNYVLERKPDYAAALSSRGASYSALGQYEKALQDINRALELKPTDLNSIKNKAVALSAIGQHETAIEVFQEYLGYEPRNVDIINALAIEYQYLNQHPRAVEILTQAIQIDPNRGVLYNNRGISYGNQGQNPQALADFQRARQLGFEVNPEYFRMLGSE